MRPLSAEKIQRIYSLFFHGVPQARMAALLGITQGAVSQHITRLRAQAACSGLNFVFEEENVDIVTELRELAIDLKDAHLTPVECRAGCRARHALNLLGYEPDDYEHLLKAMKLANTEGWLKAAVRLAELEFGTKTAYETLIAKYEETAKSISIKTGQLSSLETKIVASQKKLASFEIEGQAAAAKLEQKMKGLGLTEKRVQLVEGLTASLNAANVSDADIPAYLQRQELLFQAGFTLETLAAILKAADGIGDHDHGKTLLSRLQKLGGLDGAIGVVEKRLVSLQSQVQGLDKAGKDKAQLDSEIGHMTAKLFQLKIDIAPLEVARAELAKAEEKLAAAAEKTAELKVRTAKLEVFKTQLAADIQIKEAKVADLARVESRRDDALAALEQAVAATNERRNDMNHLAAFCGLVARGSWDDVESFAKALPNLITGARARNESPELLVQMLMTSLTGGALRILWCASCEVEFITNRKPKNAAVNPQCPHCGSAMNVRVIRDEMAVLRQAIGKTGAESPLAPSGTETGQAQGAGFIKAIPTETETKPVS